LRRDGARGASIPVRFHSLRGSRSSVVALFHVTLRSRLRASRYHPVQAAFRGFRPAAAFSGSSRISPRVGDSINCSCLRSSALRELSRHFEMTHCPGGLPRSAQTGSAVRALVHRVGRDSSLLNNLAAALIAARWRTRCCFQRQGSTSAISRRSSRPRTRVARAAWSATRRTTMMWMTGGDQFDVMESLRVRRRGDLQICGIPAALHSRAIRRSCGTDVRE